MRWRNLGIALATVAAPFAAGCAGEPAGPFAGIEGRPLAELDLSAAPSGLVLLGPDEVRLRQGERLGITVDGDSSVTEALRFAIRGGTLAVLRQPGFDRTDTAVVNVVMPAPTSLVAAGSGRIAAEALAGKADVTIAGSGDIDTMSVAAQDLKVTIAGSGTYRAAGTAGKLDMTIAGSGDAEMDALKADSASIRILGSGRSAFASDGAVKAAIAGSGEVRVRGRANCEVKATGSGKLLCEPETPAS